MEKETYCVGDLNDRRKIIIRCNFLSTMCNSKIESLAKAKEIKLEITTDSDEIIEIEVPTTFIVEQLTSYYKKELDRVKEMIKYLI